jgi:predicted dehydrogenase
MTARPRIVVVGAGSIGERHVRCFLGTGRVDVSLCEVDADRARIIAERYGLSRVTNSWDAALADRPTAAVIATPAHLHVMMARQAVAQGCHVLIEKPLAVTLDGVAELEQAVNAGAARVAVAYVYRCHPALTAMRAAIHSGRFGQPLQVVSVSGQNFPFYRPAYRETYYARHESGGGAVQDALTHMVNAVEWLVGPVTRLVADAAHLAVPGVTVEDSVHVLTRHGDLPGCFSLNQHQAPNEATITVVCERGTVRFEYHRHRWQWVTEPGGDWHDEAVQPLERDTLFIAQAEHFLDHLEDRSPPRCSLAEARQTLLVNRAILESVRTQMWQTIALEGVSP